MSLEFLSYALSDNGRGIGHGVCYRLNNPGHTISSDDLTIISFHLKHNRFIDIEIKREIELSSSWKRILSSEEFTIILI